MLYASVKLTWRQERCSDNSGRWYDLYIHIGKLSYNIASLNGDLDGGWWLVDNEISVTKKFKSVADGKEYFENRTKKYFRLKEID